MPRIREDVSIRVPPARVWRAVHEDLEAAPRWAGYLRSARSLGGRPGPGWRVRYELELPGGFRADLVLQYTAWEPPRRADGRFADGPLGGAWSYSYAAEGAGTRLSYEMDYELRGLLRVAGGLLRSQYEEGIRRGMAMLKEHLEGEAASR
jgi:uncharacterized protein YndB with AHSA1/START domain